MANERIYNYLDQYLIELQSRGRLSFSISQLKKRFEDYSLNALQMNLKRLNKKGKTKHVMKGFYVIIPPEYQQKKMLPTEMFIDALFKYLERPYYLGLLSASVYHGASHQQAMEFYVFINKPPIRSTEVEGLKINYVVKSDLSQFGIEKQKTDTGYINISNAELTACDLVEYQQRIGGLNRAATVLYELTESMTPGGMEEILKNKIPLSVLQRLGYLLDVVLGKKELAEILRQYLSGRKLFRVLLKTDSPKKGYGVHPVWKIIENYKIETDF